MEDQRRGGGTAPTGDEDQALDQAWKELAVRLATCLGAMRDESDHLVIEMPDSGDGGASPYAQFAGSGSGGLRGELSGNAYLAPIHALAEEWCETLHTMGWSGNDDADLNWYVESTVEDSTSIAVSTVSALRLAFGVPHPQLLTYRAWGSNAASAADLGLSATQEVPLENPTQPLALQPEDREDLAAMVRATLHARLDEEPTLDEDGDVVLIHLDQPVWVRAHHEQPAVEIFAQVAHGIRSRRAAAVEIAILNRDNPWVKWSLRERTVWQHIVIPALPYAPGHLDGMLDVFLAAMTATRDDVALRLGGQVG